MCGGYRGEVSLVALINGAPLGVSSFAKMTTIDEFALVHEV